MKACNWFQRKWHARLRALTFANTTRSGPEWRCQCGIRYRASQEYRNGLMLLSSNVAKEKPVELNTRFF